MKNFFYPILFLFATSALSQTPKIQRIWIGQNLEYLRIDSTYACFETYKKYPAWANYSMSGDTLLLDEEFGYMDSTYHNYYKFKINKLTQTALSLTPISKAASDLFGNRKSIYFEERNSIKPEFINFRNLKFSSSSCMIGCPAMTLEINDKMEFRFSGEYLTDKLGDYTGKIPDSLYSELLRILKITQLDKLKTWKQIVDDAPAYNLEIEYNYKKKSIGAYFLPQITNELRYFLLNLYKKIDLVKSKKTLGITLNKFIRY